MLLKSIFCHTLYQKRSRDLKMLSITFKKCWSSKSTLRSICLISRQYGHVSPSKIRNIGIIAHIDAGKTTVTEQMLYGSGTIKNKGTVDSGNTVTDFLPSERARGITVQSAAVTFDWGETCINLIDTPGHVDFSVEVERALHVLDGCLTVIDGSRGVEAQTRTVWRQADNMKIPRIAFINKMDKHNADFAASVISLQELLSADTYVIQIPYFENSKFCGIIDVIQMTLKKWDYNKVSNSYSYNSTQNIFSIQDDKLQNECLIYRQKLVEKLSDTNDVVADLYLNEYSNNIQKFPNSVLISSLSEAVKHHDAVPILCGSAFHNIGIEPILDSVVNYLPSPHEIKLDHLQEFKEKMISYAFKVVHHKIHGPMIFARVYSGTMKSGHAVFNSSKQVTDKCSQLFTVFAEQYKPVDSATEGQIVAISGLKQTGTGDTLFNAESRSKDSLSPVTVPQPVFFCTIETDSPTEYKALRNCLQMISREDPSVLIRMDESTGQIVVCGMGELHMEVVTDRLRKEFKINCYIGPIQVAYREHPTASLRRTMQYERTIRQHTHTFAMDVSMEPRADGKVHINMNKIHQAPETRKAIKDGIEQACNSGILIGFPLYGIDITVRQWQMTSNSPLSVVSAAAVHMMRDFLPDAQCCVLEPVMDVHVTVLTEKLSVVLDSLSKRRAEISEITSTNNDRYITAKAPVAEMLGYASLLRSISSGTASLNLSMHGYKVVDDTGVEQIRNTLSGHM